MTSRTDITSFAGRKAYVVTGPTSGIGRETALKLGKDHPVILVGRNAGKLSDTQKSIESSGGQAFSIVCDLSDLDNVRSAAAAIVALGLPLAGLLNNAGMIQKEPSRNARGWDMTFATNHLGPFALTEALIPSLSDGAAVLFVASTVEDPQMNPGKAVGYRGSRYISADASIHGDWQPGGSKVPGADAYATSKQCNLVSAMVLARENPRLRINAMSPGLIPTTGLFSEDANPFAKALSRILVPLLMPFMKFLSTPARAADVIISIMLGTPQKTETYYDERGHPLAPSAVARDPAFQERVVSETRALLTNAGS